MKKILQVLLKIIAIFSSVELIWFSNFTINNPRIISSSVLRFKKENIDTRLTILALNFLSNNFSSFYDVTIIV